MFAKSIVTAVFLCALPAAVHAQDVPNASLRDGFAQQLFEKRAAVLMERNADSHIRNYAMGQLAASIKNLHALSDAARVAGAPFDMTALPPFYSDLLAQLKGIEGAEQARRYTELELSMRDATATTLRNLDPQISKRFAKTAERVDMSARKSRRRLEMLARASQGAARVASAR